MSQSENFAYIAGLPKQLSKFKTLSNGSFDKL